MPLLEIQVLRWIFEEFCRQWELNPGTSSPGNGALAITILIIVDDRIF